MGAPGFGQGAMLMSGGPGVSSGGPMRGRGMPGWDGAGGAPGGYRFGGGPSLDSPDSDQLVTAKQVTDQMA